MKTVTATVCSLEREGDPTGGVALKMTEPTTIRLPIIPRDPGEKE
jgi:hypothetical protein